MKIYLKKLIDRVKDYSYQLDKLEYLVDIPWVLIDEEQSIQKYIFKRNGELIMSINGNANVGKWEYISSAKSILIDRNIDKILLNHIFFNEAIMALKFDNTDNGFNLINELIIPDLDIEKYLNDLYYSKNNIKTIEIDNGQILEIIDGQFCDNLIGKSVMINGVGILDDYVLNTKKNEKYFIKKGILRRIIKPIKYKIKDMYVYIEHGENGFPQIGDAVYKENGKLKDGKYYISFLEYIHVKDGVIVKKTMF